MQDRLHNGRAGGGLGVLFISEGGPMRLEAALRSFFLHCTDASDLRVMVDYPAIDAMTTAAYEVMSMDFPGVEFRPAIRGVPKFVDEVDALLLIADDSLFVSAFDSGQILGGLSGQEVLAMVLGIGGNTVGGAPVPEFEQGNAGALGFRWVSSAGPFAAPLEGCAVAVPRALLSMLQGPMSTAGDLRPALAAVAKRSSERWQRAVCPVTSVCLCVPDTDIEGAGAVLDETLTAAFLCGSRVDLGPLVGLVPDRAVMSMTLKLGTTDGRDPLAPVSLPMDGYGNFSTGPRGENDNADEGAGGLAGPAAAN